MWEQREALLGLLMDGDKDGMPPKEAWRASQMVIVPYFLGSLVVWPAS
jgi:hypothetical protein